MSRSAPGADPSGVTFRKIILKDNDKELPKDKRPLFEGSPSLLGSYCEKNIKRNGLCQPNSRYLVMLTQLAYNSGIFVKSIEVHWIIAISASSNSKSRYKVRHEATGTA